MNTSLKKNPYVVVSTGKIAMAAEKPVSRVRNRSLCVSVTLVQILQHCCHDLPKGGGVVHSRACCMRSRLHWVINYHQRDATPAHLSLCLSPCPTQGPCIYREANLPQHTLTSHTLVNMTLAQSIYFTYDSGLSRVPSCSRLK